MADTRISRNAPCPCRSGKKFGRCCLLRQPDRSTRRSNGPEAAFHDLSSGFGSFQVMVAPFGPPGIAVANTAPSNSGPDPSYLPPDLKGQVFLPDQMKWQDASLKEVKPGQEFIADDCLFKVRTPTFIEACPEIDVSRIADATRPFAPANWRAPESVDVVYVLGEQYPHSGHWLLCDVQPHQRFLFQGRVYFLAPGRAAGVCNLMDTGQVVHGPDVPLYVLVEYTAEDALGKAAISYCYPKGRLLLLTNGDVLPVEGLTPGMEFLLELGGSATVTKVNTPQPWDPNAEFRDGNGNAFRRVIGTFRFDGWVQLMTVTVAGEVHRVTPGHPYWSVTRQGWYPIGSFVAGELLLTPEKVPIPIQALTPPQWVRETVYNVEVEQYHPTSWAEGSRRSGRTTVWATWAVAFRGPQIPIPLSFGSNWSMSIASISFPGCMNNISDTSSGLLMRCPILGHC
jgi:hypothetical protein